MSCKFTIAFTKDAETVLGKAKAAVEKQNGTFSGDTNSGEFSVSVFGSDIKGNYTVEGNNLNMEITDKPFLIPCNAIESFLKNQLVD